MSSPAASGAGVPHPAPRVIAQRPAGGVTPRLAGSPRTVKLCLMGFGSVNRELCRLFDERRDRLEAQGLRVLISAAGTRHASFLDPAGVEPAELLRIVDRAGDRLPDPPLAAEELIGRSAADVMVEATVLEHGGAPLASAHIETAFRGGLDVVTVNKGPVAWEYARLQGLAEELSRRWRFEGVVADGMPVFDMLDYCLRSCEVLGFEAIFNGTSNFIIEEVGRGRSFEDALAWCQAEGIAEADPAHDIDGVDGASKVAALANVAMDAGITPDDVPKDSIRGITTEQVGAAAARGHKLCVVCSARRAEDGRVEGSVRLTEIPLDHPLAPVRGSSLGLLLHTDLMADLFVAEYSAMVPQTAYGVYADIVALSSPVA